ncbi:hypothetical protein GUMBIE_67 [Mycobacterium phage GUmbie]|uniref:Uncharacterized protein n=1 Tax=Mycobacterium phage GUmbie TaxID=2922991 RepID=G1JTL3_9CAUD|nr:hypothetical protein CL77_gp067 [Mycobacterium phage GUmbie]AEL20057.1 hypothetical protein GUMBIE_67 [Mycobacterium phage GUmbie]
MITVACAECARTQGRPVSAEFNSTDEAEAFIRRHHALADHRAHIPEEAGLVSDCLLCDHPRSTHTPECRVRMGIDPDDMSVYTACLCPGWEGTKDGEED